MLVSLPMHTTELMMTGPAPWPKFALYSGVRPIINIKDIHNENTIAATYILFATIYMYNHLPVVAYPSCLHTTEASVASHVLSHTLPHTPPEQYSTLPSLLPCPAASLTVPLTPQLSV